MERVGQTLRTGHGSGNATDLTKQILADPKCRLALFKSISLSQDEIKRSLPKI